MDRYAKCNSQNPQISRDGGKEHKMKKRATTTAQPQAPVRSQEPLVRHPGVFCCWIYASKCNFIGPEKTCKLGELGECPHKFIKPNDKAHGRETAKENE